MGSYWIPNNKLKGEGRILYIFTFKSLIASGIGAAIGFIIYSVLASVGMKKEGFIVLAICAAIGYGVVTLKVPEGNGSKLSKNVGGDTLDEIIKRYIVFKQNRKIYSYSVERKEPDYLEKQSLDNLKEQVEKSSIKGIQTKGGK